MPRDRVTMERRGYRTQNYSVLTVGDAERRAREVDVLPGLLHDKREDGVHPAEGGRRRLPLPHLCVRHRGRLGLDHAAAVVVVGRGRHGRRR